MGIRSFDLRQYRFRRAWWGFDRAAVTAFLDEAADDYEAALSELGRLRQDVTRLEEELQGHCAREAALCETLQTAQQLADEMREQAHEEARGILQEAQHRAEVVLLQAQEAKHTAVRQITNVHDLARLDAKISLEASLTTLRSTLARVEALDQPERVADSRSGGLTLGDPGETASLYPFSLAKEGTMTQGHGSTAQPKSAHLGPPVRSTRRCPRARVSGDIAVWIERDGTVRRVMGRIVVLGAGGAYLEIGENYPVGTVLGVAFTPDPLMDELTCAAVVRNSLDGQGIGVEFLDLDPLDQARIQTFVEHGTVKLTLHGQAPPPMRR